MNFFDLHADTPLCWENGQNRETAVDLIGHPFGAYTQTLAVFLEETDPEPFLTYQKRVEQIKTVCKRWNIPLRGAKEIPSSGALLSVENAAFLAEDPTRLERLWADGVRMVGLTWNGDNRLAGGCAGQGGLTALGCEIIREINRLGMVLDLSHLSKPAAEQAVLLAEHVVASHSCADAVFPHRRNISTSALCRLREKDGLIGLCFYPEFLGSASVIDALEEQITYLCRLGMEKNIAIGSDFDGARMAPILSKTADIPPLYAALFCRGMKKSLLDAIFYENALAFFCKMCENI